MNDRFCPCIFLAVDLNAVFERIDRTTSKVGQQCLYARIRTLRGQEDAEAFGRSTDCFSRNGELAASCTESLSRLTDEDAYGLQNLIFDTPAKVRYFAWVYPLTLLAVATLLAAPFYPLSLLLFMAAFTFRSKKLDRWEGAIFLAIYIAYIWYLVR